MLCMLTCFPHYIEMFLLYPALPVPLLSPLVLYSFFASSPVISHINTGAVLIFTTGFLSILLFALETTLWHICFVKLTLLSLICHFTPCGWNQMPEKWRKLFAGCLLVIQLRSGAEVRDQNLRGYILLLEQDFLLLLFFPPLLVFSVINSHLTDSCISHMTSTAFFSFQHIEENGLDERGKYASPQHSLAPCP